MTTIPDNDLQVDATEAPVADLCETDDLAMQGVERSSSGTTRAFEGDSLAKAGK